MSAYEAETWHEFFIGSAGAVAALSGLIFVAVSVNLSRILEIEQREGGRQLTGRALEALIALVLALMISLVGLTPDIEHEIFGASIVIAAVVSAVSPILEIRKPRTSGTPPWAVVIQFALAALLTLSLLIGGVSVLLSVGGGLYWLPGAFVLAVTVAAVNAWVLLVEVLR